MCQLQALCSSDRLSSQTDLRCKTYLNSVKHISCVECYKCISNGSTAHKQVYYCSKCLKKSSVAWKRTRDYRRTKRYRREIDIGGGSNCIIAHIKHEKDHMICSEKGLFWTATEKAVELAVKTMSPFQIVSNLRIENIALVLYNDVYNVRVLKVAAQFRSADSSHQLSITFINSSSEFQTLHKSEHEKISAMTTNGGVYIASHHKILETFIGSTLKKINEKTEILILLISITGSRLPLGYFLLGCGTNFDLAWRLLKIPRFLKNLGTVYPELHPYFLYWWKCRSVKTFQICIRIGEVYVCDTWNNLFQEKFVALENREITLLTNKKNPSFSP